MQQPCFKIGYAIFGPTYSHDLYIMPFCNHNKIQKLTLKLNYFNSFKIWWFQRERNLLPATINL